MNKIFILCFFLTLTNCGNNISDQNQKKIKYYPSSFENVYSKYNINDSFASQSLISKNLKNIIDKSQDNIPYFIIEDDSTINYVKIKLFWNSHSRYFDNLHIANDSIWFNKNYPIQKLDSILPLHYFNRGKYHYSSKNPQKASIMIELDTMSRIENLKDNYTKILNSYKNKVERKADSTELTIKWNFLNFIPPPPPPAKND